MGHYTDTEDNIHGTDDTTLNILCADVVMLNTDNTFVTQLFKSKERNCKNVGEKWYVISLGPKL
jgi:hypothetical protein